MSSPLARFLSLAFLVSASYAQSQTAAVSRLATTATPSASPAAYVYLASGTQGSSNTIGTYSASADGTLTHLADAAVPASMRTISVNANYLFAGSGTVLYSFRRGSNGSLSMLSSFDTSQLADQPCAILNTVLDHTGATLYVGAVNGGLCEQTVYEAFSVNKTTGALQYLSSTGAPNVFNGELSFIGNNVFAYAADCTDYRGFLYGNLVGYQRTGGGELSMVLSNPATPSLPANETYCPGNVAADPANHVAVSLTAYADADPNQQVAPSQIAAYTSDGSGGLTTTNTAATMPFTLIDYVSKLDMAPSGKLLAAGGDGLQLFHFNGAAPADQYTNLLTQDGILDAGWDNANHLFALGKSASSGNTLHVYTATSAGVTEVAGSPYTTGSYGAIAVLPEGPALADTPAPSCAPPSSGVRLCSPGTSTSLTSPLYVSTSATAAAGHITAFRIYVDNVAQALVSSPTQGKTFAIDEAVAMAKGTHNVVVVAYESTGGALTASRVVTIQ